jgi:predicted lipid-binding transport protein (Tim44 family)
MHALLVQRRQFDTSAVPAAAAAAAAAAVAVAIPAPAATATPAAAAPAAAPAVIAAAAAADFGFSDRQTVPRAYEQRPSRAPERRGPQRVQRGRPQCSGAQ